MGFEPVFAAISKFLQKDTESESLLIAKKLRERNQVLSWKGVLTNQIIVIELRWVAFLTARLSKMYRIKSPNYCFKNVHLSQTFR